MSHFCRTWTSVSRYLGTAADGGSVFNIFTVSALKSVRWTCAVCEGGSKRDYLYVFRFCVCVFWMCGLGIWFFSMWIMCVLMCAFVQIHWNIWEGNWKIFRPRRHLGVLNRTWNVFMWGNCVFINLWLQCFKIVNLTCECRCEFEMMGNPLVSHRFWRDCI